MCFSSWRGAKRPKQSAPSFRDGALAPDLRCAIAHRGISRFRVRVFDAPRNDGLWNTLHSQTAPRVLHAIFCHHRATDLAKTKRILKWQRDPEGMRLRILEAAKQEFAAHGLAGARVDA